MTSISVFHRELIRAFALLLLCAAIAGAGFKASLRPALEKTPQGFIVTGYDASYQTSERVTRVQARLEYQQINGLQLPRKVYVDTIYEGKPAQIEWVFTDYQVKVR